MSKKMTKCKWCGRTVQIMPKGGLGNHVDAGGKKCVAVGIKVAASTLTPPKRLKGVVQRNAHRTARRFPE